MRKRYSHVAALQASWLGASGVTIWQQSLGIGLRSMHQALQYDFSMGENASVESFYHPRYWPSWLGLGVLRAAARLSYPDVVTYGRALGELVYQAFPFRAHVARVNLRLCFPERSEAEREELVRENYAQMGVSALELGHNWYRPDARFDVPYTLTGLEHVRAVQAAGRPVLLLIPHFTNLETTGRIIQQHLVGYPQSLLYRPPNNRLYAREMHRKRLARLEAIPMNDVKSLIRALKRQSIVFYAPDQGRKIKDSALVPFFGEPAVTNTATSRLARMTNAAVLPIFTRRDEAEHRHRIDIQPEMLEMHDPDPLVGALAMNQRIEEAIRQAPAQYLWLHKRFKRRGPELPDVYKRGMAPSPETREVPTQPASA
ncbi:MAG: lipid A biosynthesis lauroyl acyltransferase [Puniceicoccaceae bacterium 5H]|nr:MAG: lipid A biosynthesis lauroyl acyltransferase [Puniceicoccaceae bacterium 5H]